MQHSETQLNNQTIKEGSLDECNIAYHVFISMQFYFLSSAEIRKLNIFGTVDAKQNQIN